MSNNIFDEANISKSSWFKFSNEGDYIHGTLTNKKTVKSNYAPSGESPAYDILVKDGISGGVKVNEGVTVSVGGDRKAIEAGLSTAKLGQIVGIKFMNKVPSKTKGYTDAKIIKVFTKGEMNQEWLDSNDTDY